MPLETEQERKEEVSGSVERNIRSVVRMERMHEEGKSLLDHLGSAIGAFVGSKVSIIVHLAGFSLWLLANLGHLPGVPRFDPFPCPILGLCVSIEAVILSTFVLFKQNHMQQRTDHRDQLNLQMVLLTEKELTKALQLLRAISIKLEISESVGDAELAEMSQVTSVGTLAERILTDLPPKS